MKKLFTLLIIFVALLFCSKQTTSPETVTFSGTVTLPREGPLTWEGETNYGSVKVSLYKPVQLDTALLRINQQYPNIGVQTWGV